MDDIEDFGDTSEFETPMHFQKLLRDIDNGLIPKLEIMTMMASLGYDDLKDLFEEIEIDDPDIQSTYIAFQGMYDIFSSGKIRKVPANLPYCIGFEFDGEVAILFLEDEHLINYISFDW